MGRLPAFQLRWLKPKGSGSGPCSKLTQGWPLAALKRPGSCRLCQASTIRESQVSREQSGTVRSKLSQASMGAVLSRLCPGPGASVVTRCNSLAGLAARRGDGQDVDLKGDVRRA